LTHKTVAPHKGEVGKIEGRLTYAIAPPFQGEGKFSLLLA